jgi:signal transduction histidine kinase
MKRVRPGEAQNTYQMLEDLIERFRASSESLELSYSQLQQRVKVLSAELEKEREERIRLERMAAMGEMAMELAHEIRNPLASIELYASMLTGRDAEQIVRSVRLLNHTVTNTLQFGRPINPICEPLSAARLFKGIISFIEPIAGQKKIRLEIQCEPDCVMVADGELMHRMLLNLVLNAMRVTPTHGCVRIRGAVENRDVLIFVEDNGPGVQEDIVARIFDPMFSTHREGCGLGLSIVKRIVESHDGTIDVSTSPDGTSFRIRLRNARHNDERSECKPDRAQPVTNMEVACEPATCCR